MSIWHRYDEAPEHQDIIMTDTGCWAYKADLLALETELERTRKALEEIKKVCDGFRWCESNIYMPDYHDGRIIAEIVNEALEQKDK